MAVNKVIYNGRTLIDLTAVDVTPETLAAGSKAMNAAGELIEGTMQGAEALTIEEIRAICV